MSFFQIHGQMKLICGGKFSDRVSSEKLLAVSAAGPPAAFFPEIDISGFFGHAHFWKKCVFVQIWSDLVYSGMGPNILKTRPLANQAGWGVRGAIAPR